jgi:hypothetical protein
MGFVSFTAHHSTEDGAEYRSSAHLTATLRSLRQWKGLQEEEYLLLYSLRQYLKVRSQQILSYTIIGRFLKICVPCGRCGILM